MRFQHHFTSCAAVIAILAGTAHAQNLAISIGIRETGTTAGIGADGGTANGIEWVNLDGQTLVLDGTWQTFTFNFQGDQLTAFAGATANAQYDGTRGALEHIRIRNIDGITLPIQVFIDDIINTVGATPTIVSGFEANDPFPATVGTEHVFQEPGFSGSTAGFLEPLPNTSLVTDQEAFSGLQSLEVNWQFNSNDPAAWVRLTTFSTPNQPNPTIDFRDGSTLTLALKGIVIPEPATGGLLVLGSGLMLLRRRN